MRFPSLFKKTRPSPPPSYYSSSWQWPSCKHPRTQSFRAGERPDDVFKTANSVYIDTTESWFTNSSEELASDSFSASSEGAYSSGGGGGGRSTSMETVIRGLRSEPGDRLFFEPGGITSSIMEDQSIKAGEGFPFKESVAMAVESADPYADFRLSMAEMVAAHGLRNWACLEELLEWYLRVNGKTTHRFILGAFVDLLIELSSPSFSCCSSSWSVSSEVDEEDAEEMQEELMGCSC